MYNVLIIDDEPIVKIALRSILSWEEHGFVICGTASNGAEALPLIRKHQPDIIITDLKMPEMDGLELIRILKKQQYPGEILVLSNYEDFDSVRNALILGAADYLLKIKIKPDTLLVCLNKTIEKLGNKKTPGKREVSLVQTDIAELLLQFFTSTQPVAEFIQSNREVNFSFVKDSCSICYVTFENHLSNEDFFISPNLLRDMILDAVQGLLQPFILLPNDYSALVVLSQQELTDNNVILEQLLKKLYNRFTLYQSFAPTMLYRQGLENYEEARTVFTEFRSNEGCYKADIAKIMDYINENYMHRITLASISEHVSLSPSYLCRIFKAEVGTSITSYLNSLRIRKAAELIRQEDMPLKEISSLVGIDDQLYFSRLFRKCMGMSPSEYGKRFHLS